MSNQPKCFEFLEILCANLIHEKSHIKAVCPSTGVIKVSQVVIVSSFKRTLRSALWHSLNGHIFLSLFPLLAFILGDTEQCDRFYHPWFLHQSAIKTVKKLHNYLKFLKIFIYF